MNKKQIMKRCYEYVYIKRIQNIKGVLSMVYTLGYIPDNDLVPGYIPDYGMGVPRYIPDYELGVPGYLRDNNLEITG